MRGRPTAVAFSDDGLPIRDAGLMRMAVAYQRLSNRVIALHDGVVVEEAYQYDEAAGYMPYIRANKPVFAVEYGSSTLPASPGAG